MTLFLIQQFTIHSVSCYCRVVLKVCAVSLVKSSEPRSDLLRVDIRRKACLNPHFVLQKLPQVMSITVIYRHLRRIKSYVDYTLNTVALQRKQKGWNRTSKH